MAIFEANTEILSQEGKIISQLGEDYKANISNIYGVIGNLSEGWSGGASDKYKTAFTNYQSDLNNLGDAIINMGSALQGAAAIFNENEENLASSASHL